VAINQPQSAHAVLTRSLQFEWSFLQSGLFPHCVNAAFYLALLSGLVFEGEVCLFALPARYGGLGVSNPVESAIYIS